MQTDAKCAVQPLDESRVNVILTLRQFDYLCDGRFRLLEYLAGHTDNAIVLIALDHLCDQNVGPNH